MYKQLQHQEELRDITSKIENKIKHIHKAIEQTAENNQLKVLQAFQRHQVSDFHFTPSTGYGYGDLGRETLDEVFAEIFGADAGIVRPQIMSGTHAITLALFGVLRPDDELLYITGHPYDTLEEVIGVRGEDNGSLRDFNVSYQGVPLTDDGKVNYELVRKKINEQTKVIGIQRSTGYSDRRAFTIAEIEEMTAFVKRIKPDVIVFVDNCYGEFVEEKEPCHVGVDLAAGSLIKNPGGGIVKTGGYIVGKETFVSQCAQRLTAPGIGGEIGSSLYSLLEMYQGLFLAPHIVSQALKGAIFTSAILDHFNYVTTPHWSDERSDLVQSVQFRSEEEMITFCQAIQRSSPIDSHVTPLPSEMPGYDDQVIMAGGTFIQGSSIELSADGPLRPPYTAYIQGGLTYSHVKIAILSAIDQLVKEEFLSFKT